MADGGGVGGGGASVLHWADNLSVGTGVVLRQPDLHFCLHATTFGDSVGRRVRLGRRRCCLINEHLFIADLFGFPFSGLANRT